MSITRRGLLGTAAVAGPWDCHKLLATTPADQAFRPLADGKCPLAT